MTEQETVAAVQPVVEPPIEEKLSSPEPAPAPVPNGNLSSPEKEVKPPENLNVAETRIVPVELNNVNLKILLRTPITVAENFQETQNIIARLREQFGDNALIEQLSQIVWGTIEMVTISVAQPTTAPVVTSPAQQAPVHSHPVQGPVQQGQPISVAIPQTNQDVANYQIQSTQCPWTGNSLKMLDPVSIYKVLYESQQHRNLMTQQDLTMLEAYYRQWYQAETAKQAVTQPGKPISFDDDDISF